MAAFINCPSEITCSCTIEWLSSNGSINKTAKAKRITLSIMRNEFRDMFVCARSGDINLKLILKDVVVHKKFADEGKATLKFPESKINLLINNAPPSSLVSFLKTLFIKICSAKSSPKLALKDRLLSTKERTIQEVSPVSSKDVKRVQTETTPKAVKRSADPRALVIEAKRHCSNDQSLNLSPEQERVLHEIKRGSNVFFTGSAGTGKSYLLQQVINVLPPQFTVASASTGSAACLIGGVTLHSFAGIGTGECTKEKCLQLAMRKHIQQNWRNCDHLIIDEISMIDASFFDKVDYVARHIRKNEKPFGGVQVIVCGDFLQLPPVNKEKTSFCFMSEAWESCKFSIFNLKQVHRQSDPAFISILNGIRLGQVSAETTEKLRATATQQIEKEGILATRLCCFTREAKKINDSKLEHLSGDVKKFVAVDEPESVASFLDDCTPVEKTLLLKVGAQVMLLKNMNVSQGLVNGARGVIEKFVNGLPVVKFISGVTYTVKHEKWVVKSAGGALLVRKQLPLKLAWAFSIHKSQGLTLDCVEMCLNGTFESGQAYVALSRAKSLDTLRVIGFNPKQVWANPDVLKFYKKISICDRVFIPLGQKKLPVSRSLLPLKQLNSNRDLKKRAHKSSDSLLF